MTTPAVWWQMRVKKAWVFPPISTSFFEVLNKKFPGEQWVYWIKNYYMLPLNRMKATRLLQRINLNNSEVKASLLQVTGDFCWNSSSSSKALMRSQKFTAFPESSVMINCEDQEGKTDKPQQTKIYSRILDLLICHRKASGRCCFLVLWSYVQILNSVGENSGWWQSKFRRLQLSLRLKSFSLLALVTMMSWKLSLKVVRCCTGSRF